VRTSAQVTIKYSWQNHMGIIGSIPFTEPKTMMDSHL